MMKRRRIPYLPYLLFVALLCLSSCDLLNCTPADVKGLKIEICDMEGNPLTLSDTLTVTACGTDSVLLNRSLNTKEMLLPMSYQAAEDTFVLRYYCKDFDVKDTLFVAKTNHIYYESPDCPTVMMHTIEGVRCAQVFVDSVEVVNKSVDFVDATNVRLFIR